MDHDVRIQLGPDDVYRQQRVDNAGAHLTAIHHRGIHALARVAKVHPDRSQNAANHLASMGLVAKATLHLLPFREQLSPHNAQALLCV